jgi:hypothetical protein
MVLSFLSLPVASQNALPRCGNLFEFDIILPAEKRFPGWGRGLFDGKSVFM